MTCRTSLHMHRDLGSLRVRAHLTPLDAQVWARLLLRVRQGSDAAVCALGPTDARNQVGPLGNGVLRCSPETHGLAIGETDCDIVWTRVVGNVVSRVPYVCALAQGRVHSSIPQGPSCGPAVRQKGSCRGPLKR